MKAIQDRYANLKMTDPAKQKMNTELMSLYRERGVNPASGCVPMLLTLPGAAGVLLHAVGRHRAARRAVHRLDPRPVGPRSAYITPVLMGITQFLQTKMTPTTARSDAAEDDAVHADHHDVVVHLVAERAGPLLDDEQPVGDRSAGADQPADRPAEAARRAAAGGAAHEERRRRQTDQAVKERK